MRRNNLILTGACLALLAVNAHSGIPSGLYDGSREGLPDLTDKAVFAGEESAKGAALKSEGYTNELEKYSGHKPPEPDPKQKPSNPFWEDFFGPQFASSIEAAAGLSAVLGVAAGLVTLNPLAGLVVFALGTLLLGSLFNFLK